MKKLGFALLLVAVLVAGVHADAQMQYETVVRDTSFNSASKVILDEEAIKKSKAPNMSSLLATQANISVSASNFQPGSLFLRGGDSSHILILIDGLPFYDVSTTQRTLNLNELDIKTIRRIEIIKGSQSVLYGGQALSGVIKIETLPQEIQKKNAEVYELGMRDYKKASLMRMWPVNEESAGIFRLQGASKANRSPVLDSSETYRSNLVTGDLGFVHLGAWDYFFKATQINDQTEISSSNLTLPPGPMTSTYLAEDTKDFNAGVSIKSFSTGAVFKQSPLRPKLLAGYQFSNRSFIQSPDTDEKYDGELINVRFESSLLDTDQVQILFGSSYLKEKLVFRASGTEQANDFLEQTGVFAKLTHQLTDAAQIEAGVRTDSYKSDERVDSYQVGLTMWDKLRLEASTGFKNASLFQLYGGRYANPDLQAEKSQSYSLSYDQKLGESQFFSITGFETTFKDLITTRSVGGRTQYYNVSKAKTQGLEAQYSARSMNGLKFDASFGYQEPKDLEEDRWLLRRPLQTGSLRLTQEFSKNQVGYEVVGNGERLDTFYSNFTTGETQIGSLPAYYISNFFVTHEFTDDVSAYIRGNNIWNSRHEQSRGFHDEGAFWLLGLEISN